MSEQEGNFFRYSFHITFQKILALIQIYVRQEFMNDSCGQEENMGKDTSWKDYFADPSRFADAINGFGCEGKQLVSAKDLEEADTFVSPTKHRDVVRKVAFGVNYVIVGLENQEAIDYSLPLRNMIYDVGEYESQVAKIRKDVRNQPKGLESGEYLYGFRKDSKLMPVTTFVLYSGIKKWDGPTCLHDMLQFEGIPNSLRELVPNYKINIISTRELRDTSVFQTDLRYILDFMQCAEDYEKLKHLTQNTSYYQNMDEDAYDVIAHYTKSKELMSARKYYTKEGKVDMCKGLQDWMLAEKVEGIIKTARKFQISEQQLLEHLMQELHIDEAKAKEYILQAG